MSESITVLNHREANPAEGLLPRPAVLSSTGWDGIHLELYQQPRFATAEHQHTLHAIAIGLPNAAANPTGYRWLDGQRQREERPDGLAIIPAGVSHRCSWDSEAQFMVLALEPALLQQVGQDWVNPDRIQLVPQFMDTADSFIQNLVLTLQAEVVSAGLGSSLLVDALKTALAIHLLRGYCETQPRLSSTASGLSKTKRNQVKEYIDANLHQDLKLVELAAIAQISPAYFARLFKQSEGISPHQYILQRRVEQAQALLCHSELSLADIAVRVGFCDQSHLTRCFNRLVGVTPTQFRQR
ncbi:helix-turn-helix domain-containing protein [Nodosilinea sp. AN01ver1]|uniref:helix-turn-helix domain-containing protein n=1 Tax=Nodosilinea sp. AN01ver1 TaxID=3423362 RepID=UPI003D31C202